MRRLLLAFASILCLLSSLRAQDVKLGPVLKEPRKTTILNIVGHHPDRTVILKGKPKLRGYSSIELQQLNGSFAMEKLIPLKPMQAENKLDVEFCIESNGGIYFFGSIVDGSVNTKKLYLLKVNSKTLLPEGSARLISELHFERSARLSTFSYDFSRDSSKVLIYGNPSLKKREMEEYSIVVLDQDMEQLWAKSITLPYPEAKFAVEDFAVDNDGNVFVLGVKYAERGESKRRGKPNYEYKILSYRQDGDDVDEYSASLGDYFITDMRIDVSPKRDIVCAGFYSEKGTFSIKGSYYLRIDRKTKAIASQSSKEFGIDFITMNFTEGQERRAKKREAKGKNVELYEYDLDEIVPRGDGGAVLVAEQYYVTVVCRTDPKTGVTTCTYYYHYNDIIVVSIGPDGQIEWATKIPKRQTSVNDYGYWSSYAMMIVEDKLHFIFNDTRKNLDIPKQGKYYNFSVRDKNGVVMLATVDSEGNVERRPLIANAEITAIVRPKLCQQVNSRQMLLYAKYFKGFGRGSQFGLVTF
ncbi:MAG: hypothetical protein U0176_14555 [Bacteroidia bacterium]